VDQAGKVNEVHKVDMVGEAGKLEQVDEVCKVNEGRKVDEEELVPPLLYTPNFGSFPKFQPECVTL
jgi:hypothetical protein